MRHQSRNPAITVRERMNPKQSMVGGGGGNDGIDRPQRCIHVLEPFHEPRNCSRADRDMPTDRHLGCAEFPWLNGSP
jgi:hypothetical protein